jgi:hypothetical protein
VTVSAKSLKKACVPLSALPVGVEIQHSQVQKKKEGLPSHGGLFWRLRGAHPPRPQHSNTALQSHCSQWWMAAASLLLVVTRFVPKAGPKICNPYSATAELGGPEQAA